DEVPLLLLRVADLQEPTRVVLLRGGELAILLDGEVVLLLLDRLLGRLERLLLVDRHERESSTSERADVEARRPRTRGDPNAKRSPNKRAEAPKNLQFRP